MGFRKYQQISNHIEKHLAVLKNQTDFPLLLSACRDQMVNCALRFRNLHCEGLFESDYVLKMKDCELLPIGFQVSGKMGTFFFFNCDFTLNTRTFFSSFSFWPFGAAFLHNVVLMSSTTPHASRRIILKSRATSCFLINRDSLQVSIILSR